MEQSVALVAVENVAYHFDIFYSYCIPENLKEKAVVGTRVLVPFGRSKVAKRQGIIFGFAQKQEGIRYKDIICVLDEKPFFTKENIEKIENLFDEVVWNKTGRVLTNEEMVEMAKDCDAILTCWGTPEITKEVLDAAPNLKIIAHMAGSVASLVKS